MKPFDNPGLAPRALPKLAWLFVVLIALSMARAGEAPAKRWAVELRLSDGVPALGNDGTIYLGTFGQTLVAVSTNGETKWTFKTDSEIKSSPAVGRDGTIYFGCRDHKFYAVTPQGKKKWEFLTGAWVDSSPALGTDGTIYFGSWDKRLYALDAGGALKWKFETGAIVDSSPAIGGDGTIYFGSHDKKFYALGPDGRKRWEFATGGPIISSPALSGDGAVYFTSVDGYFYAVDEMGGLRWRLHTGSCTASSPVTGADGTIYVGVNKGVWAITADGKKKWERVMAMPVETSPTSVANDVIYVSAHGDVLIALESDTRLKWAYSLYPHGHSMPAIGPDGEMYILSGETLTAFETRDPLARSAWPKFRGNSRNTGNLNDAGK